MPPPRPPSRVDPVSIPVFGLAWYPSDEDDHHPDRPEYTAYCGGGGSARTGVRNLVVLQQTNHHNSSSEKDIILSTDECVGLALVFYASERNRAVRLLVALDGGQVRRYAVPDGTERGRCRVTGDSADTTDAASAVPKESCCAIAVNARADRWAVGCDSGRIFIGLLSPDDEEDDKLYPPRIECRGHTASICALAFSFHANTDETLRLLSSAKDGTARVWDAVHGTSRAVLTCELPTQKTTKATTTKATKHAPVLVRGAAFANPEGTRVLTVASARRGPAYLTLWAQPRDNNAADTYILQQRWECAPCPVSAMSLAPDQRLLALGTVDGSIRVWHATNTKHGDEWTPGRVFAEVHDLPVTGLAARSGGVFCAQSASADGQLASLSLRRAPKGSAQSQSLILRWMHRGVVVAAWLWLLAPLAKEYPATTTRGGGGFLWASADRPGIRSIPI